MRSNKLSLVILAILFSITSLSAQTDSLRYNSQVQFHLVNGYSLSYLSFFNSSSAYRIKMDIALRGSSGTDDVNSSHYYQNSGALVNDDNTGSSSSNSTQSLNFSVHYIWRAKVNNDINFYTGIGPVISYSRDNSDNTNEHPATLTSEYYKNISVTTSSSFGLGVQVSMWFDFQVAEKILLLAEFDLNGTYNWNKWKSTSENHSQSSSKSEYIRDGHSWNYNLYNLKIGIAYSF